MERKDFLKNSGLLLSGLILSRNFKAGAMSMSFFSEAQAHTFEAEAAELIGGAAKVANDTASGGYLVSLAKPGQAVRFTGLPEARKLAIRYASVTNGTISVAVNNQPARKVNIHSSGALTNSVLYSIIDIAIPRGATLTISLEPNDVAENLDKIIVGKKDLGLSTDIWNLPSLPVAQGSYSPDWKEIGRRYVAPEWWRDAKFGAWSHWDPQSMPEDGDWYARVMYIEGNPQYEYHLKHFGHPSIYDYKDICHNWVIDRWNPGEMMDLYVEMGARYFMAMGCHHDNFDCFDSKYQPWNSVNVGPKVDIVGTWEKIARINSPLFLNFDKKTLTSYVHDWVLEPDSLLTRPTHPNASATYNESDPFQRCRGLPSYAESVQHGLVIGVDVVAAIYRGYLTYASILKLKGYKSGSIYYIQKAKQYQQELEDNWWDKSVDLYNTYYTSEGKYGKGEGETFLLWFNILRNTSRINATINHLTSICWNVDNTSYLPYLLYQNGRYDDAYKDLLYLSYPTTKRRDYPEVSFGVVQGIVLGCMGVEPDAPNHTIRTFFRGNDNTTVELDDLPVMRTIISLKNDGYKSTTITDEGKAGFSWEVKFPGRHTSIHVKGKALPAKIEYAPNNHVYSFAVIRVNPGERIKAFME